MTSSTTRPPSVTVCVTGGIAAYKACLVVRGLMRAGAVVDVLMTEAATRFVSPLTFEGLTQRPVLCDLWDRGHDIAHVEMAHGADLFVVAPATAHTIARLALGLADDVVTATLLASSAPVLVAPAMETGMWRNPLVQGHVARLEGLGRFSTIGPEEGLLASGRSGEGRMSEPDAIVARALALLGRDAAAVRVAPSPATSLAGARAVVTAGPTREFLDPVRFVSNPSSGKMGFAVAAALAEAGAEVTLIHGPVSIAPPRVAQVVPVVSAEDMCEAVLARAPEIDLYVGTAAIADYTPVAVSSDKVKKTDGNQVIEFRRTPDVIANLVQRLAALGRREHVVVMGFAVETRDVLGYARDKLVRKGLDLIAANDVSKPGVGFAGDVNELVVVSSEDGEPEHLGPASKTELARTLVRTLAARYAAKREREARP
ncbi:MAG: bifunctional phosphopantothenoylcysteine decarboxylase/phosphopantothenate--cysteine ligase CoaBC [Deltaproteobacteria bacterium]|nr:bifunctional phosphopantothenoylcysteine decarboxylase/phosphopantothenate--cysteine ligase CoaBC [Deltaproteobacteria bacterium]